MNSVKNKINKIKWKEKAAVLKIQIELLKNNNFGLRIYKNSVNIKTVDNYQIDIPSTNSVIKKINIIKKRCDLTILIYEENTLQDWKAKETFTSNYVERVFKRRLRQIIKEFENELEIVTAKFNKNKKTKLIEKRIAELNITREEYIQDKVNEQKASSLKKTKKSKLIEKYSNLLSDDQNDQKQIPETFEEKRDKYYKNSLKKQINMDFNFDYIRTETVCYDNLNNMEKIDTSDYLGRIDSILRKIEDVSLKYKFKLMPSTDPRYEFELIESDVSDSDTSETKSVECVESSEDEICIPKSSNMITNPKTIRRHKMNKIYDDKILKHMLNSKRNTPKQKEFAIEKYNQGRIQELMSIQEIKSFNYLYWYKKNHNGQLPPNALEIVRTVRRECLNPFHGSY